MTEIDFGSYFNKPQANVNQLPGVGVANNVSSEISKVDSNIDPRFIEYAGGIEKFNLMNPLEKAKIGEGWKAVQDGVKAGETPWTDYGQLATAGLGAATGVASYFDNKALNQKKMEGLDTNIQIAKAEQAHRKDFRGSTKSAFA